MLRPHGLRRSGHATRLTVAVGKVGRAAAVMWLLAAVGVVGIRLLPEWENVAYIAWANLAVLAGLGTTLMLAGLLVRSGGLRGWLPAAVLLAAGGGTVLLAVATWAWPLGTGLLAVAGGLVVWRVHGGDNCRCVAGLADDGRLADRGRRVRGTDVAAGRPRRAVGGLPGRLRGRVRHRRRAGRGGLGWPVGAAVPRAPARHHRTVASRGPIARSAMTPGAFLTAL